MKTNTYVEAKCRQYLEKGEKGEKGDNTTDMINILCVWLNEFREAAGFDVTKLNNKEAFNLFSKLALETPQLFPDLLKSERIYGSVKNEMKNTFNGDSQ